MTTARVLTEVDMRIYRLLLSLIFPPRCPFCGKAIPHGLQECEECTDKLPIVTGEICPRCGRERVLCHCTGREFTFERCVAPFYYEGVVRRSIIACKFHARQSSAAVYGRYAAAVVLREYAQERFDFVTFVPLTRAEYRKRGFNQSELVARSLAHALGLPCRAVLQKPVDIAPQRTLPALERWSNVSGAFCANTRMRSGQLRGKNVLLADDIATTGATLSDCARALKEVGTRRVYCVVLACVK